MTFQNEIQKTLSRRAFLARSTTGLGALALSSLLNPRLFGAEREGRKKKGALKTLHSPAKAKRVIYLFQSGAPSHLDLFDSKPKLKEMTGEELPPSVRMGQRITGMTAGQAVLRCVGSPFEFKRYGKSGVELSSMLPNIGGIVDDIAIIRSMFTEPINHDPAVTFLGTGNQQPGRPTMGAWLAYGLGSENDDLPGVRGAHQRQRRSGVAGALLGQRLSLRQLPGRAVPQSGRPGGLCFQPAGLERHGAAAVDRCDAGVESQTTRRARRPGHRHAHRQLRTGVPHANQRAGIDGHRERAEGNPRNVRRRTGQGVLREQLPAGPAPGRTRRALHPALPSRLGPSRRLAQRHQDPDQEHRPGQRRAWSRTSSSAACSTTRW